MRPWRGALVCLVLFVPLSAPTFVAGCADGNSNDDNTHGQVFDAAQPPYDGHAGGGGGGGSVTGDDSGGSGDDASNPYDAWTGPAQDGGEDAGADTGADAPEDTGSGPPLDAGEDGAVVAPTCDGVVQTGEYGSFKAVSGTQTWYMSWDDTNLYLAVQSANVLEGNIVYLATSGTDAGVGLTAGNPYDATLVSSLPFSADFVIYAKSGYSEVRAPAAGDAGLGWNALDANAVTVCVGTSSSTREEVIPWRVVGGRPTSFEWLGYVAANPGSNPTGYIYGQVPADDPGGANAGQETFPKYFSVPSASPGANPFVEQ